jgi:co-chaperonin GroES (HSP10)
MRPSRGTIFVKPIDEIPSVKSKLGFGEVATKEKPEEPYKFLVVAVGEEFPHEGLWIDSEVKKGNVVSLNKTNSSIRAENETSGFLLNGERLTAIPFDDILGIWES